MFILFLIVIDIVIIGACAFVPYITRKTELFGVSLPSSEIDLPQLGKLRAGYRNTMLILGVVFIIASAVIGAFGDWSDLWALYAWLGLMALYLVASFVFYLTRHKTMKRIKAEMGWADIQKPAVVVASTTPAAKDVISSAWLLLYPLIILLSLAALWLVWPQIPDPAPTHFSMDGQGDAWTEKGPRLWVPILAINVFLAVVMIGVHYVTRATRRQIDAANPEESLARDMLFRRYMSIAILAMGVLTLVYMNILQILTLTGTMVSTEVIIFTIAFMLVLIAGIIFFMFRIGQGGSRLDLQKKEAHHAQNYDDDKYWILGLFYFNPADPAVFVEKRFGLGMTANLARPLAWIMIGGLLVFIVVLLIVVYAFAS